MVLSASGSAVLIGLSIFTVAGYQAMLYKDYLGATQQDFSRAPVHITVEVVLAFALCLWGSLGLAGTFKPINPFATQKGLDARSFRPDFLSFKTRAELMPLDIPPLEGSL